MPSVVLVAEDADGKDVLVARVTMDGKAFAEKLGATALPVDPGNHVFRFEAPGTPPAEATIFVREGEKGKPVKVVLGASKESGAGKLPLKPALT